MSHPPSKINAAFHALISVALTVFLSGCPSELEKSWQQLRGKLASHSAKTCQFENPASCPPEEVCVFVDGPEASCHPRYSGSTPFLKFPFDPHHSVSCLHGSKDIPAGHAGLTTLHSLDLTTSNSLAPPGQVFASLDGVAVVFSGCAEKGSRPAPVPKAAPGLKASPLPSLSYEESCGSGYGNHVRILSPEGFVLLYAQLESVNVATGQAVRIGELIGTEGRTGRVTRRQLHFSLHHAAVTQPWVELLAYYRDHPGALPPAIPFETQYCEPGLEQVCRRMRTRETGIPCGKGAPELRADWRD